jgi:hypothetical protein
MSESQQLDRVSPLVADKLRAASPGDKIFLDDRKTPLKIIQRFENQSDDAVVFNCASNGYDYTVKVAEHEYTNRGKCQRFASRGVSGEDLTDELQGVLHNSEDDQ